MKRKREQEGMFHHVLFLFFLTTNEKMNVNYIFTLPLLENYHVSVDEWEEYAAQEKSKMSPSSTFFLYGWTWINLINFFLLCIIAMHSIESIFFHFFHISSPIITRALKRITLFRLWKIDWIVDEFSSVSINFVDVRHLL